MVGLPNPGIFCVEIQPGPDRTEFFRDMEATRRVYDLRDATPFAVSLMQRRARFEVDERIRSGEAMTRARADAAIALIIEELEALCSAGGYW